MIKTELWNGYQNRFVEKDGEWWQLQKMWLSIIEVRWAWYE
ncbi:hypothetical protein SAMN02746066_04112 [Anaerosporobacter mobilis DSM 15930]|jgi:hypothetical protein|uniref:Uncharacterized protein n=1 Tax=Anaerosporobacter mobilis DSM 15930 TaxID=1120996 RepID=A0A1M7MY37_9FIRM|nr:hypothetical protein [Anaerosporobacter mobilis]SHM96098.1 hypothetical protein SAMN02746066_04112 [Anaerosporobacter mobilis DSM 15930]